MKNLKEILLHSVPVALLALGAIFGLDTEEQNSIAQALTAIIGGIFGVLAIWRHHKMAKQKDA